VGAGSALAHWETADQDSASRQRFAGGVISEGSAGNCFCAAKGTSAGGGNPRRR